MHDMPDGFSDGCMTTPLPMFLIVNGLLCLLGSWKSLAQTAPTHFAHLAQSAPSPSKILFL
jgi:hypothetical protein